MRLTQLDIVKKKATHAVPLYKVRGGSKIRIASNDVHIPPASLPQSKGDILTFFKIDGMYGNCKDADGNWVYIAAWTDVEIIDE